MIASEDRYAVKQYFDLFHSTRIQFHVLETEDGKSAPDHVMARLEEYLREFSIGEGDQFWVVLDTDHWIEGSHIRNLIEVVKRCKKKEISVALSNPCFDLWLLLHFDEFPAESNLKCIQIGDLIRAKTETFNKTKVFNLPITQASVVEAIGRASDRYDPGDMIPTKAQTAVHLILNDLIGKGMIRIHQ